VKRGIDARNAVRRVSARSAALVHGELKRGLNSLASIAATARLIGLFGTVIGGITWFKGLGTERSTDLFPSMARSLSASLVPTALGLLVAVLAFCCHRYLMGRLENLDLEMETTSLQLVNELSHLPSTNF
jgi:biopolymer transport protein ExbB